jgi:signal transduction histidine kinase/ActR/RegA family two-component response regulator
MAFLDANLQPITSIKVTKNSVIYSSFAADFKSNLILFIIGCIALATICLLFFIIWVNMPLKLIAAALNRGDIGAIKKLEKSNTEFGDLSRVVKNSFQQKQDLLNEIESRKLMVDALKRAIAEMETAQQEKQKAEKADIAKSLFLSTMSHEIRTPINGVIGIANLLLCENPSPSQEKYIKLLEFSAKHLKLLVDDILDYSKIEAGKFEFSSVEFDMNNMLKDIFSTHQLRAVEKGITLKIETDETLNHQVVGDNLRFNQIVTNLLSNAVKFTDEGSVTIKIQSTENTATSTIIQLSVTDTGIGMTPEQQSNLFKQFTQANMEVNRKYGGTGLGLAISKKLVELQGGNIAVSSEIGKGSTFMVSLKFGLGAMINKDAVIIKKQSNHSDKNLEKLNILVAEDNKINTFVVKQFLSKWNVGELDFAENGQEAFDMACQKEYDLILMDLQMPTVDGYEATHKLRESNNEYLQQIPIIALSADAAFETKNKVIELGFNGYVSKPFDPEELFKEMMKVTRVIA